MTSFQSSLSLEHCALTGEMSLTFPQIFKPTALFRFSWETGSQQRALWAHRFDSFHARSAENHEGEVGLQCFPTSSLLPSLMLYHFGSFELYMAFYLSQSFAGRKTRTFPVFPLTVIRIWLSKIRTALITPQQVPIRGRATDWKRGSKDTAPSESRKKKTLVP